MSSPAAKILLGVTPAANKILHFTGASAGELKDTTTLGLSLLGAASASAVQQAIDAEVGVDVQAYSARLGEIAALTPTDSNVIVGNGSGWVAESGATARTSLGLGTGNSPEFTNMTLTGNLKVNGAMEVVLSTIDIHAADYMILNGAYTSNTAMAAGVAIVTKGSTTTQSVAAGGFTAGSVGVGNPAIEVSSTTGFSGGDLVQVSGSTSNDGIYEVQGVLTTPTRLDLRGVGLHARVEDFTKNDVTTEAGAGTVTKCTVTVLRAGTDGALEVASGNTTGFSFVDIATQGSKSESVTSITNDYSITAATYVSATVSSQKTATLPTTPANGFRVKVKNKAASSANLLVARGGSDTLDGSGTSLTLVPGSAVELVYVAASTDWEVWA